MLRFPWSPPTPPHGEVFVEKPFEASVILYRLVRLCAQDLEVQKSIAHQLGNSVEKEGDFQAGGEVTALVGIGRHTFCCHHVLPCHLLCLWCWLHHHSGKARQEKLQEIRAQVSFEKMALTRLRKVRTSLPYMTHVSQSENLLASAIDCSWPAAHRAWFQRQHCLKKRIM